MTKIRQVFTEALNPVNKVVNSIIKKLNYVESHIIIKANDGYEIDRIIINDKL